MTATIVTLTTQEILDKLINSADYGVLCCHEHNEYWCNVDHCFAENWQDHVYSECPEAFIESIENLGVQVPILISDWTCPFCKKEGWYLENGHHRFVIAHRLGQTVPVSMNGDFEDTYDNDLPNVNDL